MPPTRASLPTALAAAVIAVGTLLGSPSRAVGQGCDPVPAGSNEAKLLEHYAGTFAFAAIEQPQRVPSGLVTLTLEGAQIPGPDRELSLTRCPPRTQALATQLARWFVRPRVAVGLPFGFHAEGAWLPPAGLGEARTNLIQGAVAWTGRLGTLAGNGVRLQLRAHGTIGDIRGPITCPASALRPDAAAPCYGRTVSQDRFRPGATGAEALLGVDAMGYAYYAGVGATSVDAALRVDFTSQAGVRDQSVVRAPRTRLYPLLFGGSLRFTDDLALLGQYYVVPGRLSLLRLGAAWRPAATF